MIETIPPGTILNGHYRVERVLGSGGFGHVYLGVDLAANQQYALKEYLVSGASAQEQLKHEATVLSHLRHAHLPAFQDAFTERGRYYIVLNYIEGNDLTDLIHGTRKRNEVVPVTQIMNWLLAICDAVMFLHAQHPPVIHRDVKPDNIRITSNGMAILVDLGNAKAAVDGARTLFFIRHQGTPGYAPPEQYPGGTGTDTRSDVYALGGTLYFALTAHEPPSVSTRNQYAQQGRADLPSLQEQLANNPPEISPEANAVRQFRLGVTKPAKPAPRHSNHLAQLGTLPPEVLNQLNTIIQRAMAMKPKDRYQYVEDLANDLKQVINAFPQPTPPGSPRTLDPNSTQPDLPMLYETLQQAAKDNANQQGDQGIQASPPPSSPSPIILPPSSTPTPTATHNCPRCGTSVNQQAMFCPRCGTSLGDASKNKAPHSNSASNAISAEQTMIITPAQSRAARTSGVPASPRPASQSQISTPDVRQVRPQRNTVATQPSPVRVNTATPTIPPAPNEDTLSPSTSGFNRQLGALLSFIIVLVLVVTVIALLVINHH